MGRQSRQPTKPRLAVLARRATKSGAPCHPFPSGCCRKCPSLRCKGSAGAQPAFAFAPCTGHFRPCNAFVSIALTGPRSRSRGQPRAGRRIEQMDGVSRHVAANSVAGHERLRAVHTGANASASYVQVHIRFRPKRLDDADPRVKRSDAVDDDVLGSKRGGNPRAGRKSRRRQHKS